MAWVAAWFVTGESEYRPSMDAASPWVASIRTSFASSAARFGGDGGALLPGLVVGDTSAVSESLADAMRVSSLTHLMAVSGSNCAVVTGLVFGLAALVGLGLWWRIGLAAASLVGFVVLVGGEPSVLRASAMALIALATLAIGTSIAGVTLLCLAVLGCLALDPALSHSVGFALSVAATLGLLVLARPLSERLAARLPRWLATVLAVPLSASIACQPIVFLLAPYVPTYGVIANALADPLVPVATIAGLLALITAPLPWLSTGFAGVGWLFASVVAAIARVTAALPVARIPWPAGVAGFVLGAVISIGLALWILGRAPNRVLWVPTTATALALSLTAGGNVLAWSTAPRDWTWAQCDVGQGDAVLVRDSGLVALIDVGRDEPAIRECLGRLGVDHVDLLVLTHFDIDHVGAIGALYGKVDVVVHGPTDGIADEVILRLLTESGARLVDAHRGIAGALGHLNWSVLWPADGVPVEPGNPASVVVRFDAGSGCDAFCVDGVDLGDLPAAEQTRLLRLGALATATVVKVSHHGSRDQDPNLYRLLHSSVGLIGVGADNDYGHPTDEALDMLASTGTLALRSDHNGIVLISRDRAGELRVWRERS